MKKSLLCCICLLIALSFVMTASASVDFLPSIDLALKLYHTKIEVGDNLDEYRPDNGEFSELTDDIKMLILQRQVPQKEFTAKVSYPPFSDDDGFDEDFEGVDIGKSRIWLRADLMSRLPDYLRADSLEDATYLLIAEDYYVWDGTISVVDYKDGGVSYLPDFESTEEMVQYFIEHPKEVKSRTYYPKFGAYTFVTLYEVSTKRNMFWDLKLTSSRRFARNPEASALSENMSYLDDLLDALADGSGLTASDMLATINKLEFIPQSKIDLWNSCIKADEYTTAQNSVEDYYWAMAADLRDLDSSLDNQEKYDLIIRSRDRTALRFFVNFCDYSGFDRSISSIESSRDYIASPDYDWMEQTLNQVLDALNQ